MRSARRIIVGLDEAGRGPLCGPVVTCAFFFKPGQSDVAAADSKKLSALRRQEFFEILCHKGYYAVSFATHREIDRYNILQATMLAFNRAVGALLEKHPYLNRAEFIVDGPMFKTDLPVRYRCINRADSTVREVSAASIIAKVTRDHLMEVMDALYPEWNFSTHKGYPTREHRNLLARQGSTPFHRKTFDPVK